MFQALVNGVGIRRGVRAGVPVELFKAIEMRVNDTCTVPFSHA